MNNEQLLRNVISAKEALMGDTPTGADWAIKALHPSDPLTEVGGIPDMSAATSLCMNYQTTFTLSPSPGSTGTWSFDATLLPHPINFMAIQATDSTGSHHYEVLNSQIPGANHAAKAAWLAETAQQWRLAYAGVTMSQDGPDLANQGTIVAAQTSVTPYRYCGSAFDVTSSTVQAAQPVEVYTSEDLPSYEASQTMPNAYFDLSKKGVYVPLKLTKTCQAWKGQSDMVGTGTPSLLTEGVYSFPTTEAYAWPHWELPCTYCAGQQPVAKVPTVTTGTRPRDVALTWGNYPTSPMLNDVMAHVSARNLAVTTSFSLFFRFGIEMRVQPGSTLSPQLKLAPKLDERALRTYFSISRELKDGYEARFNDLGKLWSVISGTAKEVLPLVGKIGPIGQAVSSVGSSVVGLGDAIQKQRQARPKKPKKPKSSPRKTKKKSAT